MKLDQCKSKMQELTTALQTLIGACRIQQVNVGTNNTQRITVINNLSDRA
ncbi:MAG: hypothetical protein P8L39_06280 [Halioglobus sp.]|nr:hypothetical protein [Halioglobus sp.]